MEQDELPRTKFVRFQNGDDIICEFVELSDDDGMMYMIMNPLKVVYMQSRSGNGLQVGFIPWVFPKMCAGQEFTVHPEDVLLISDTSMKMNGHYWENLDYYTSMYEDSKSKEESSELEEDENLEALTEILEQLQKTRRTFH